MRDIAQAAARLAGLDPQYRPFADRLRQLARGYQSQVLRLMKQHLGAGSAAGVPAGDSR